MWGSILSLKRRDATDFVIRGIKETRIRLEEYRSDQVTLLSPPPPPPSGRGLAAQPQVIFQKV